jgi:hypothetical protein
MIVAHDKVLYVIALPVIRLHFVILCFTPTCYILHIACVIFRQVRVTWSDRREEHVIWRHTLLYNSAKLCESDCLLRTGCSIRYSRNCPPVTDPNAVFRFPNRPFLDPFLSWSTHPTFIHPIAILPFWYIGSGFFHSHISLQLWLALSTPMCVREVCLILRPFRESQIPNSRYAMKMTIKWMNTFMEDATPYWLW